LSPPPFNNRYRQNNKLSPVIDDFTVKLAFALTFIVIVRLASAIVVGAVFPTKAVLVLTILKPRNAIIPLGSTT
jgi:hypothetical protein